VLLVCIHNTLRACVTLILQADLRPDLLCIHDRAEAQNGALFGAFFHCFILGKEVAKRRERLRVGMYVRRDMYMYPNRGSEMPGMRNHVP